MSGNINREMCVSNIEHGLFILQIPDVKRELSRYGGEERGIRASVVKSVKLK